MGTWCVRSRQQVRKGARGLVPWVMITRRAACPRSPDIGVVGRMSTGAAVWPIGEHEAGITPWLINSPLEHGHSLVDPAKTTKRDASEGGFSLALLGESLPWSIRTAYAVI